MRKSIFVGAIVLAATPLVGLQSAQATQSQGNTLATYDSQDGDFISGGATAITNYSSDTTAGATISMRARDRVASQPNAVVGNRYYVNAGTENVGGSQKPALDFDYQFDPGTTNPDATYFMRLSIDTNPAFGVANFVTQDIPVVGTTGALNSTWQETDGYFKNGYTGNGAPGTGIGSVPHTWSSNSGYVIANSTNIGFLGTLTPPYDPNAIGEYEFRLQLFSDDNGVEGNTPLASIDAFAVTPEPASLSLLGIGALGLLARRRRA